MNFTSPETGPSTCSAMAGATDVLHRATATTERQYAERMKLSPLSYTGPYGRSLVAHAMYTPFTGATSSHK
ncbi:hypothetical protein APE01nite_00570 [Acetobacter peroxydans]|uniref:Uncharacterized protein n=1 Tax=Acetobacter peroxydans TaxID=104098 RepID=A0A4Y3TTG2_9PROT|nr:hypothetical protein APE01nite_00570 [Acetobacter peroxydans]